MFFFSFLDGWSFINIWKNDAFVTRRGNAIRPQKIKLFYHVLVAKEGQFILQGGELTLSNEVSFTMVLL